MSVGEDHQSNARPSRWRPSRLGRRHTFAVGLVAGAATLELGRMAVDDVPSGGQPAAVAHREAPASPVSGLVDAPSGRVDGRVSDLEPPGAPDLEPTEAPGAPDLEPTEAPGAPDLEPTEAPGAPGGEGAARAALEDPPIVEPKAPPAYYRVALTTRAAPADLVYELPLPDLVRREGVLQPNQFLATILTEAGATLAAQDELFRALRGKFDFRLARPGQRYRVEVDHQGLVVSFEYRAAVDEVYRAWRTDEGDLKAEKLEISLTREEVEVEGEITKSLWDAFNDANESWALAMEMAETFRFDIDFFHDTRKGDRFRLFVERFTNDEGELVRYGRIYAAEYIGAPGSPVGTKRLFWFQGKKTKGYYDEKGKAAQRAFLRSPLKFTRVSSPFGYRRHPILGRRHFHGGVDYAAPRGTPVHAVASGTVIFAARKGPNGKMVQIRHPGGYISYYLHLSRYYVRRGQRVGQSTLIGRVGSTGRSTGPHLDFRLKKHGKYINPRKHVAPRTKKVASADRAAYFKAIEPWIARLEAAETD